MSLLSKTQNTDHEPLLDSFVSPFSTPALCNVKQKILSEVMTPISQRPVTAPRTPKSSTELCWCGRCRCVKCAPCLELRADKEHSAGEGLLLLFFSFFFFTCGKGISVALGSLSPSLLRASNLPLWGGGSSSTTTTFGLLLSRADRRIKPRVIEL